MFWQADSSDDHPICWFAPNLSQAAALAPSLRPVCRDAQRKHRRLRSGRRIGPVPLWVWVLARYICMTSVTSACSSLMAPMLLRSFAPERVFFRPRAQRVRLGPWDWNWHVANRVVFPARAPVTSFLCLVFRGADRGPGLAQKGPFSNPL